MKDETSYIQNEFSGLKSNEIGSSDSRSSYPLIDRHKMYQTIRLEHQRFHDSDHPTRNHCRISVTAPHFLCSCCPRNALMFLGSLSMAFLQSSTSGRRRLQRLQLRSCGYVCYVGLDQLKYKVMKVMSQLTSFWTLLPSILVNLKKACFFFFFML